MPMELLISVATVKSCFVSLPLRFANILWDQHADPSSVVVEIRTEKRHSRDALLKNESKIYCGWNGGCSQPIRGKETLLIDSVWAKQLGLVQEQPVQIAFHSYHSDPNCSPISQNYFNTIGKQIFVEPLNEDDWEILELNAGYLEEQFLNQAKVVFEGEPLTIWLHNQTYINIKIGNSIMIAEVGFKLVSIDPVRALFVKLIHDTEIIVSPKKRINPALVMPSDLKKQKSISLISSAKIIDDGNGLSYGYIGLSCEKTKISEGSLVCVQIVDFDLLFPETSSSANDSMKSQIPSAKIISFFAIVKNSKELTDSISIPKRFAEDFYAVPNSKMRIVSLDSSSQSDFKTILLQIPSKSISTLKITESVKSYLLSLETCIVFSGMQIETKYGRLSVVFKNNKEENTVLNNPEQSEKDIFHVPDFKILSVKEIECLHFEVQVIQNVVPIQEPITSNKSSQLFGIDEIYKDCKSYLENLVGLHSLQKLGCPFPGGLLVYGSSGCGKSALIERISKKMEEKHRLYLIKVNCDEWKGMNPSKIKEKLDNIILKSIWHQPSLLVFEDIDYIVGAEDDLNPQSSISSLQISLLFIDHIRQCLQNNYVLSVFSCKDKANLHPSLLKSHLFGQSFLMKPPNKKQRSQILEGLIGNVQNKLSLELDDLSGTMEGYSVSDLKAIYTQALQKKAIRGMKSLDSDSTLQKQDFEEVLKTFKPLSLTKSKLEESTVSWQSIGGMKYAKEIILQTLKWPTKYARIFESSPLRLRSGILLYGYPGCGKTMLASAVAKECGLNFISVKGPELLNKYIGQSEKSVRDVFERAKTAAPCVLFFDEFDSIAPRRGHDNSGVTDRVVNQFLTEMDGAEGLKGVYVLAATSRPDLIDPALLRPGRLDKAVLCDIPSEQDRLEIIETITSSSIEIHSSVSKLNLARDTTGFTGADIQGLLYSSQLLSINEKLEKQSSSIIVDTDLSLINLDKITIHGHIPEKRMEEHFAGMFKRSKRNEDRKSSDLESILVYPSHIKKVLNTTRPSILDTERKRLEKIYKKFSGKGYSPENVGSKTSYA